MGCVLAAGKCAIRCATSRNFSAVLSRGMMCWFFSGDAESGSGYRLPTGRDLGSRYASGMKPGGLQHRRATVQECAVIAAIGGVMTGDRYGALGRIRRHPGASRW